MISFFFSPLLSSLFAVSSGPQYRRRGSVCGHRHRRHHVPGDLRGGGALHLQEEPPGLQLWHHRYLRPQRRLPAGQHQERSQRWAARTSGFGMQECGRTTLQSLWETDVDSLWRAKEPKHMWFQGVKFTCVLRLFYAWNKRKLSTRH